MILLSLLKTKIFTAEEIAQFRREGRFDNSRLEKFAAKFSEIYDGKDFRDHIRHVFSTKNHLLLHTKVDIARELRQHLTIQAQETGYLGLSMESVLMLTHIN